MDVMRKHVFDLYIAGHTFRSLEAARRIKSLYNKQAAPAPPIVVMTASAMKGDPEKILENGLDGYVAKPFSWPDLSALLQDYLG